MTPVYELPCDCGAVTLVVRGAPVVSAYCHCASCRRLHGVDVLSASAWPPAAVTCEPAGAQLMAHRLPDVRMARYHCARCGQLLHGRNRRGYIVIPNARFRATAGGALPAALAPTSHCFYAERVLDIADDLPKHAAGTGDAYSCADR